LKRPNCTCLTWIIVGVLVALFTVICVYFVDIPVALYVKNHLYANRNWSKLTTDLPDLLLIVVVLTTFSAWSFYMIRRRKGKLDNATDFARILAWATPASFVMKHVLKGVFGRVNTRFWLEHPGLYGFHWFQNLPRCDGFPSGHMLVFAVLLAALCRFYPQGRPLCVAFGALLGFALIATNYHFVSDVVAGAYIGALIETVAFRLLFCVSSHMKKRIPIPH
jgi:membrane-associated phospholipid phosphatase